ncbi:MAG: hydroxyacid dehydrogenase [Deltaproteobacteria bacterium]|nr:hydroxyacid dehydrogenase [Deltaproteobacteria bacterium]
MKILVSDVLADAAIQEMKNAGLDVTVKTGMKGPELAAFIGPFHVLAVRSQSKVTEEVIAAAKNLKLIVRAGVGLDNVDAEAARAKNIRVENTPHATTITVAEHTFALMLALVRHIPQAWNSLRQGEWDRKTFQGSELKGKTLGILGLGRIGQEVAKRAKAFGMHVIANDNAVDSEVAEALEIEMHPFEKVVALSDILSIHLPLTPKTKNLFDADMLHKMKKGARLINAARGGIVDEKALAEALQEGHLAGAAIDVFEEEPPAKDNLLFKLKNVIAVPHIGAATDEGQSRAGHEAARIIIEFVRVSLRGA